MSKLIGISGNLVELEYPSGKIQKRVIVGDVYVKAIAESGGIPIIIPITNEKYIKQIAEKLDGLVLTGGGDISPELYGENSIKGISDVCIERDKFEIGLLKETVALGKPVLGICRGMQLINIFFGGSLYQDIGCIKSVNKKHWQDIEAMSPVHSINIENNSILCKLFGKNIEVNSFHHQAIKKVADEFKVTAWSTDGVIEAIENLGSTFILGVQWHPEEMIGNKFNMMELFREFIKNT